MSHHALDKLEGGQDDRYGEGFFYISMPGLHDCLLLVGSHVNKDSFVKNDKDIYLEFRWRIPFTLLLM